MKKTPLCLLLLATLFAVFSFAHDGAATAQPSAQDQPVAKKKILFIAGPRSHGNGEHEFKAGCMLLAKCLNENTDGLNIKPSSPPTVGPKTKVFLKVSTPALFTPTPVVASKISTPP